MQQTNKSSQIAANDNSGKWKMMREFHIEKEREENIFKYHFVDFVRNWLGNRYVKGNGDRDGTRMHLICRGINQRPTANSSNGSSPNGEEEVNGGWSKKVIGIILNIIPRNCKQSTIINDHLLGLLHLNIEGFEFYISTSQFTSFSN